jgi:hypothetical protein
MEWKKERWSGRKSGRKRDGVKEREMEWKKEIWSGRREMEWKKRDGV